MNKFGRRRRGTGFTLIELLVVLTILGLLAGLVGPQIWGALGGSKRKTAKIQIEEFSSALDLYRLDVGRYPNSSEGLRALVERPGSASNWNGPYLKKKQVPKDPWDNEYQYRAPGEHAPFDMISLGADHAAGGTGENEDVVSWN